ncbi:hypothetical protein SmJEL517_g00304 [Synchytrium microbalum]|uniref:Thioredoxin-dependent peroxiredoxin n=1 Tax=Synchytrium microbalum TaxID=1806994 RepID=A0A507CFA8_9FUNG|nr:uncharacterized protein SmJEL517_g00304 [Synchytrium microbalum]TPX38312.1 hypothetical protein SmJEL517_g00304 [Synchytrium microbalum]
MTIAVGQTIPSGTLVYSENPEDKSACAVPQKGDPTALFKGKKVVLFAVPGAFTPTCHIQHLPGYVQHIDDFKAKGVDIVGCIAANDVFVMDAWGKSMGAGSAVHMYADVGAEWSKAMGLDLDLTKMLGSVRTKRYALILNDNKVEYLGVDAQGLALSGADAVLGKL